LDCCRNGKFSGAETGVSKAHMEVSQVNDRVILPLDSGSKE
jgi:hypothetical protein